jgi:SAM-dependent methyltransferase
MTHIYDRLTATHYAAYRPPLHPGILRQYLPERQFATGLDIGCGTGHSSVALAAFCQRVIALDPSVDMLSKAIVHPKIEYIQSQGDCTGQKDESVEIITFAGSLYYCKTQPVADEVSRVLKENGTVLIYDFNLLTGEIFDFLNLTQERENTYQHAVDFSGLNHASLTLIRKEKDTATMPVYPGELVHVILSEKDIYRRVQEQFQVSDPVPELIYRLRKLNNGQPWLMTADIFITRYEKV